MEWAAGEKGNREEKVGRDNQWEGEETAHRGYAAPLSLGNAKKWPSLGSREEKGRASRSKCRFFHIFMGQPVSEPFRRLLQSRQLRPGISTIPAPPARVGGGRAGHKENEAYALYFLISGSHRRKKRFLTSGGGR